MLTSLYFMLVYLLLLANITIFTVPKGLLSYQVVNRMLGLGVRLCGVRRASLITNTDDLILMWLRCRCCFKFTNEEAFHYKVCDGLYRRDNSSLNCYLFKFT